MSGSGTFGDDDVGGQSAVAARMASAPRRAMVTSKPLAFSAPRMRVANLSLGSTTKTSCLSFMEARTLVLTP